MPPNPDPDVPGNFERRHLRADCLDPRVRLERLQSGNAAALHVALDLTDPPEAISQASLLRLHEAHFGPVWAPEVVGRFRRPGELAMFGGHVGADARDIGPELDRLREQCGQLKAGQPVDPEMLPDEARRAALERIAFFHARFIYIHPFLDGNGRIGRLVAQWQEWHSFGDAGTLPAVPTGSLPTRDEYFAALRALPFNLGPLINHFRRRSAPDLPEHPPVPPPFPVAVRRS